MNEIELKLAIPDPSQLTPLLGRYELVKPRHFEDNMVFDRGGELRNSSCVLRLRQAGETWLITFKGAQETDSSGIKSRPEYETAVADGVAARKLIESLGYDLVFRYQKYRTVYRIGDLEIMLDETPMGHFIELEGPREQIAVERSRLGLDQSPGIRESYIELYLHRRMPSDPPFMVFPS